ncbi:MAG: sodium transporter, partial [Myxococcota bacterium]|nr:sodium transporter [Myxococcota bacterium]
MTALDAAIVLAFVAYAVGAGFVARRRASRGMEEYFLAGRGLRGWQAGMSMTATQFAADTPLVVTGLIATAGLFALWQLWSYGVAFLLLGFLFAPSWRRARVLTDAELSELRYSGRGATVLRGVRAALFGLIFNAVVVAMVLFAATVFAERFLLWHAWLPPGLFEVLRAAVEAGGVVLTGTTDPELTWVRSTDNAISLGLILAVTFLYATTGGLRSVVATDVVQLVLMLGATAWYAARAVGEAGGLDGIRDGVRALAAGPGAFALRPEGLLDLGPQAPAATAGLVLLFSLQWLLQRNADGTGYLAQRAMGCRSDSGARRASVLFAFLQIVLRSWLWVPLGLALLVLYPPPPDLAGEAYTRDREATFVVGMRELLPAGVLGVMLTGMLAALASTLDTHLNWGAS